MTELENSGLRQADSSFNQYSRQVNNTFVWSFTSTTAKLQFNNANESSDITLDFGMANSLALVIVTPTRRADGSIDRQIGRKNLKRSICKSPQLA